MVFQCCVRGCKTVAKNGLHSFPSNKSLAEKWIYAIRSDHLIELLNEKKLARSYHKVCKKHFRDIDFAQNLKGKSELIPNSVPSLFLPDEAIVSKQNDCYAWFSIDIKIRLSILSNTRTSNHKNHRNRNSQRNDCPMVEEKTYK